MNALNWLLSDLQDAGEHESFATLAIRATNHVDIEDPDEVATLLGILRHREPQDAVDALLARDPASYASLRNPGYVACLLEAVNSAGAQDAYVTLATRAVQGISLNDWHEVDLLLMSLRRTGGEEMASALIARAINEGTFSQFLLAHPDKASEYGFGREPDSKPSKPWTWQPPVGQQSE